MEYPWSIEAAFAERQRAHPAERRDGGVETAACDESGAHPGDGATNSLFADELLKFSADQKRALISGGLKVIDVPGECVLRAQQAVRELPQLTIHSSAMAASPTGGQGGFATRTYRQAQRGWQERAAASHPQGSDLRAQGSEPCAQGSECHAQGSEPCDS